MHFVLRLCFLAELQPFDDIDYGKLLAIFMPTMSRFIF